MSSGGDEVNTSVNSVVNKLGAVDSILLLQVSIESRLNVIQYRLPAVSVDVRKYCFETFL